MKRYLLVAFSVLACTLLAPLTAQGARLILSSESLTPSANRELKLILQLDPEGKSVNAVEGRITIAGNYSIQKVTGGNTIINLWVQKPEIQNGEVVFSGIIPGGYTGNLAADWEGYKPGTVLELYVTPRNTGQIEATIRNARVLLSDGRGTEAPLTVHNFSAFVDKETGAAPSAPRQKNAQPPNHFVPRVFHDPNVLDDKWLVAFATTDEQSGIDHYEIMERYSRFDIRQFFTHNTWIVAQSPYELKNQRRDNYVFVKAVNHDNVAVIERIAPTVPVAWYENYIVLVTIIVFVVSMCLIYRAQKNGLFK